MRRAIGFGFLLVTAGIAGAEDFPLTAYRNIDGTGNGIGGAAGMPLIRAATADYPGNGSGKKIYEPPHVPNARTVSNAVAKEPRLPDNLPIPIPNIRDMSDMVWAWGQFIDHDIDLTLTSPNNGTADIPVEDPDDPLNPGPILFDRSDYAPETGTHGNPRQQVNEITAFIDASNVYGSNDLRAAALRTFTGGKLKTSPGNLLPFNEDGFPNAGGPGKDLFLAGDVRANEQVGLTALHTLFVREHNRLATRIAHHFPTAGDEQVYQLARKIVGAELQMITYNEFLPALLGPMAPSLDDYDGWDDETSPGIANEFATAAYRFGHSMLSANLMLADKKGPFGMLPLRYAFFNPDFLANDPANVDFLINGFVYQRAQEVDNLLVDDVRDFLFGNPGEGGLDLAALNIQRGRDHGLPSYNVVRMAFDLPPAEDFQHVSSNPDVQLALAAVYQSPDDIDVWVGGLAEDHVEGASVGELVATVLADQFTRLRDGDLYFFLNDPDLDSPKLRQIINLSNLKLSDVIRNNTSIKNVPTNVFFVAD